MPADASTFSHQTAHKTIMKKAFILLLGVVLSAVQWSAAQNLPFEMRISPDGHRLTTGGNAPEGFYDESLIRTINLQFPQANYWQLMTNNYASKTEIPATLTMDGVSYDSVGVRFKGQTSYFQNPSIKKSFALSMDYALDGQDIMGYESLNFNNFYLDASFLREVLYLHLSRKHIPSAKANFVHLTLNGENWGLYGNIQNLSGEYLKEWFLSNDGTRWRAERTTGGGGGPGGGNPFGAGTSSLNYLGADTTLYKPHYTLKKTNKTNPWEDLVNVCDALANTPAVALEDSLKQYLDIDRTLWFLAHEILFTDDDSYVWKGGMDYFLYWEPETGRMTPLEYDGNTCMDLNFANTWSPFYRQSDVKYALMNKLFPVPALRQRYLAHVRTIIEESFNLTYVDSLIDAYADFIDAEVNADPKKIYSYNQFLSQVEELKEFMQVRRTYLLNNAEVNTPAPTVGEVAYHTNGQAFTAPLSNQPVTVTAEASAAAGIFAVRLYYATGLVGNFERTEMFDDGNHGDGGAGDGIYGGEIPGYTGGTYVRYYIEAVSANTARTVTYSPKGAEHDVFIYRVVADQTNSSEIAINEFMASNSVTASDQDGEFDDWIELYNNGNEAVDLGGWFLSDNPNNIPKWEVPAGTIIPGKGYLIVWADENGTQEGLHANFKLSAGGENLYLVLPDTTILQEIEFPEQETDMGYARIPNGTGNFVIQAPTFNGNNEGVVGTANPEFAPIVLTIFPNPTDGFVTIETNLTEVMDLEVIHTTGQRLLRRTILGTASLDLRTFPAGVYYVRVGNVVEKVVVE